PKRTCAADPCGRGERGSHSRRNRWRPNAYKVHAAIQGFRMGQIINKVLFSQVVRLPDSCFFSASATISRFSPCCSTNASLKDSQMRCGQPYRFSAQILVGLVAILLASCGGKGSQPSSAISSQQTPSQQVAVSVAPSSVSLDGGQSQQFTAA